MNLLIKQILSLSVNLLRENIRNKAFSVLSVTGFIFLGCGLILSTMAVGNPVRVIQDSGFWILGFWGLLGSVFFGLSAISHEIKNKTLYLILSRPLSRNIFILGKFLGIVFLMSILFVCLSIIFVIQLSLSGGFPDFQLLIALGFVFIEWIVLAAFSICFASFTSPFLHAFFLSALYFLGHWSNSLYLYSRNIDDWLLKKILMIIYNIFPNLEALNYRPFALYKDVIDHSIMIKSVLVGFSWGFSALVAALLIFNLKKML